MPPPPKPPRIFLDSSVIFAAAASETGASRAAILRFQSPAEFINEVRQLLTLGLSSADESAKPE